MTDINDNIQANNKIVIFPTAYRDKEHHKVKRVKGHGKNPTVMVWSCADRRGGREGGRGGREGR